MTKQSIVGNKFIYYEAKNSLKKLEPIINQSEAEFFDDLLTFVAERKF